jgi:DNA-binding response OmpR family regulator
MTDRKRRILIVDDEPDILWSLSLLLERAYDVTTAEDGATALHALAEGPYDAVILDLMMPGMDGAALKGEMDARGIDVPVVIVSAFSDVAERAAQLRVRDYMTKPIDIPKLETMLARVTKSAVRSDGASGDGGPRSGAAVRDAPSTGDVRGKRLREDRDARPVDSLPWQATPSLAGGLPRLTTPHALPRATKPRPPTTVPPASPASAAPSSSVSRRRRR